MAGHRRLIAPLVACLACLALAGCGGAEPRPTAPLVGRAAIRLLHQNRMSQAFEPIEREVTLDGLALARGPLEAPLEGEAPVELFAGTVGPGAHVLELSITYRGHGSGVFSYLSEYRFHARGRIEFEVAAGRERVTLCSEGSEDGGATTPLEDRPQIRIRECE